MRASHPLLVEA